MRVKHILAVTVLAFGLVGCSDFVTAPGSPDEFGVTGSGTSENESGTSENESGTSENESGTSEND